MGHGHAHHHGGHAHAPPAARGALVAALGLNAGYTVLQVVVGLAVGSMALLADAGHNLSDVVGLAIALAASIMMQRPSTPSRSFGLRRMEVLAALANAATVVVMAVLIAIEAVRRLDHAPEVPGVPVMVTAAGGIVVNGLGVLLIQRASRGQSDLNLRAAVLHLAADAAASIGVVVAGAMMLVFGWRLADPLVAIAISVALVASAWGILRRSISVLLEAAPEGIDAEAVGAALARAPGVVEIHDLHIWSVSSDFPALSAHVIVEQHRDCHAVRRGLADALVHEFGIAHSTLQMEHAPPRLLMPDRARVTGCHPDGCDEPGRASTAS